jgi:hypothetical protein
MITVRKLTCQIGIRVLRVDEDQDQLLVRLEVKAPEEQRELRTRAPPSTSATSNFPVIDNHAPVPTACAAQSR